MKYCSTRGGVKGASFEQLLFSGYASDGGIMLPEVIPTVSKTQLHGWKDLGFADLAKQIVPMFVSEEDIPRTDLEDLLDRAYSTFSTPEVAPIKRLKDGINILELFHGKTWAFKDIALSVVGQLYGYFCSLRKKHFTIVVGTSGDTGSAAIEAVRGMKWVDIVVMLPRGRCTKLQERQMTTVIEDNVHVFRVDGTCDDIDVVIKPCFLDGAFRDEHSLTCINSINWARIMGQIVHFFYAYLRMSADVEEVVEIVVPTGSCGNVTVYTQIRQIQKERSDQAGCIARLMGLPINLVCAVTCNDIVARALTNNDFTLAQEVTPTLASAMDIQMPFNMERIWDVFSGRDTKLVAALMKEFENSGSVKVPDNLSKKISDVIVDTYIASDDVIKTTMARIWAGNHYMVCPHTAIGVAYCLQTSQKEAKRICIATASVAKFKEAVLAAGLTPEDDARVVDLETMATKYVDMEKGENWENILRQKIIEISERKNRK